MTDPEVIRYAVAYRNPSYRMGDGRRRIAIRILNEINDRHSLLDVGCGRGELMDMARALDWSRVAGTEVVDDLVGGDVVHATAWCLPWADQDWQTVTCFDVLEHLRYEDAKMALRELARVASKRLVLTISNVESPSPADGTELHITRLAYELWNDLLVETLVGFNVTHRSELATSVSECWVAERV